MAAVAALLLAGSVWWFLGRGSQTAVEAAVKDHLNARADSVSCTEDHRIKTRGQTWVVYRCFPNGGSMDGVETCVIWNGTRLVEGREVDVARVPLAETFCEGQG
jgi:hypothetical protein